MTTILSEVHFHCSIRYPGLTWLILQCECFVIFEGKDLCIVWCSMESLSVCQVLDEYQKNFGDSWKTVQADNTQQWPYLTEALTKFQVCFSLMGANCANFFVNIPFFLSLHCTLY